MLGAEEGRRPDSALSTFHSALSREGGAGGVEPLTSAFTGPRATATPHAASLRTEDRGQRTEDRGQRTEDRGQKAAADKRRRTQIRQQQESRNQEENSCFCRILFDLICVLLRLSAAVFCTLHSASVVLGGIEPPISSVSGRRLEPLGHKTVQYPGQDLNPERRVRSAE